MLTYWSFTFPVLKQTCPCSGAPFQLGFRVEEECSGFVYTLDCLMTYAITRLFLRSDFLESSQTDTKKPLQTIYIITLAHTF